MTHELVNQWNGEKKIFSVRLMNNNVDLFLRDNQNEEQRKLRKEKKRKKKSIPQDVRKNPSRNKKKHKKIKYRDKVG